MENEILGQILGELKTMNGRLDGLEAGQAKLESEVTYIREGFIRMEHEHGRQLAALVEGQQLQSERLNSMDRNLGAVMKIVSAHDIAIEKLLSQK